MDYLGGVHKEHTRQMHQNIREQEQHAVMHQAEDEQQQRINQQEQPRQQASPYARFMQNLKPLPALPGQFGPAPENANASLKKRKKEYHKLKKQLKEEPRLVSEEEVKKLSRFHTKKSRDEWANKTLSHSTLTRGETMRMILDDGDYSNFENLDLVMRNLVASKALQKFQDEFHVTENSDPEVICAQISEQGGVSALLNPALRLGLSLAQRTENIPEGMKNFYRSLDEAMSTAVMVATLTHEADKKTVKKYLADKGLSNSDADADKVIAVNQAQQIQIAKRLLLMQLSDFRKITTEENKTVSGTGWDKSMAVALSHCSRIVLTLPKLDHDGASNANDQRNMWRTIMTTGGDNLAEDNPRASSTHNIQRRKVRKGGIMRSKEKKVWFNLIGQRGMNCAIGGLGNAGISGKTIFNDGSCGHFYSMYKEADEDHYGTMLMGLESDANGVTNQMGHTHDWHATAEKASSLGGQRTDEVGDKYGGRQCLLNEMSARDITTWMSALENKMLEWQGQEGGLSVGTAYATMQMLAGKKLDAEGWDFMRRTLGLPPNMRIGDPTI